MLILVSVNLDTYIKQLGDVEAASLFCVKLRTIESWRRGERFPRREKALSIQDLTLGAVSFAECYQQNEAVT